MLLVIFLWLRHCIRPTHLATTTKGLTQKGLSQSSSFAHQRRLSLGANFHGENWRVAVRLCFSSVASHFATTAEGLSQSSSFAHQQKACDSRCELSRRELASCGKALLLRRRISFRDDNQGAIPIE